jgi:penicillin-binding protein 2
MYYLQRIFSLLLLVLLAACGSAGGAEFLDSGALTTDDAQSVAESFLKAWRGGDFAGMYSLISPKSRAAHIQDDFVAEYQSLVDLMTLTSVESEITGSDRQGTTAIITYNVTLTSAQFGAIQDNDRTMRLVETPDGWRVAWSRLDIFDDLAEGTHLELTPTSAGRGNIYDRNGKILVDRNGTSIVLYAVQDQMPNIGDCITALSSILRREYSDLEAEFSRYYGETLFYVGEIDADVYAAEQNRLLQLCGIGDDQDEAFEHTSRRYYAELAPHLIGYVSQIRPDQVADYARLGYPQGTLVGQEGIERAYEEQLAGRIGGRLEIRGPTGEQIRTVAEAPSEPGQDVYLTIDRDLQMAVERAFVEAYNFSGPTWAATSRGAAAVVMNVKTGEILAIVSYPGYSPGLFDPNSANPNRIEEAQRLQTDPRTPLLNRAMMGQYPAGSTFKVVSVAAGVDSGVFDKDKTITCNGVWKGAQYGDVLEQRTDWKPDGHGSGIDAHWGLTYSCDPYFWELGVALHQADPMLLTEYALRMGLGSADQDVLPEVTGYIPDPSHWRERRGADWSIGDTLNLVIGQGDVEITPLQITRMMAAIANRGTLFKTLFVSRIQPAGGDPSFVAQPTPLSQLDFKPEVFDVLHAALCDVTLVPDGTARYIFEEWYNFQSTRVIVCGKTGTAETGGETTKPQAWFAAFAPREDPEIAIAVIVENSCEGSEVAAPIVRRIIEDYYHMPHSELPPLWQEGCTELSD